MKEAQVLKKKKILFTLPFNDLNGTLSVYNWFFQLSLHLTRSLFGVFMRWALASAIKKTLQSFNSCKLKVDWKLILSTFTQFPYTGSILKACKVLIDLLRS